MRKLIFLLSFIMTTNFLIGQNFVFKKVIANKLPLKIAGVIQIFDTLILIDYDNKKTPTQSYKVTSFSKKENFSQYRSNIEDVVEPYDIRFTLHKSDIYKKYPFQLSLDGKDTFTGQIINMIFLMKEIE